MKWEGFDPESGILFTVEILENGKICLNATYNKIKIDIRYYELTVDSLKVLKKVVEKAIKEYKP